MLADVFATPEVWQFPFGRGLTRDETQAFLDQQAVIWATAGFGPWLAVERSTARVLGYIGLSVPTFLPEILPAVEIGWRLHPAAWGLGYATEGARAALDEAFATLGLPEVYCVIEPGNTASVRVAERLELRLDRSVVVPADSRRGVLDAKLFVVTSEEWRSRGLRQAAQAIVTVPEPCE